MSVRHRIPSGEAGDWLDATAVIDLSVPLSPQHPCWWPGNIAPRTERLSWYDDPTAPYFNRLLTLEEHTATHIDAPAHFVPPPGRTTDQIPLDELIGPAAVVDARHLTGRGAPGCSPRVEPGALELWEREHGRFRSGDIMLLRTGWSDHRYTTLPDGERYAKAPVLDGDVPAWPALSVRALALLASRGVRVLGADCPSVGALDEIEQSHREGLGHGLAFIENLTALGTLPARGAVFAFLPLKLIGGSGAPGRAIGLLPRAPTAGEEVRA